MMVRSLVRVEEGGQTFEDRQLKSNWAMWIFLVETRVDNPSSGQVAVIVDEYIFPEPVHRTVRQEKLRRISI